jgi:hypothetical protein
MCKECENCEETSNKRFWIIVILMILIYWSIDNYFTEQTNQIKSNNEVKLKELEIQDRKTERNNNLDYLKQIESK